MDAALRDVSAAERIAGATMAMSTNKVHTHAHTHAPSPSSLSNNSPTKPLHLCHALSLPSPPRHRHTHKAVAMSNMGDWQESAKIFDGVIDSAEKNALPWWLRYAMALLETRRAAEAVGYLLPECTQALPGRD